MDLVYIPEVLTYGFFRAPQYRDYEQPWNKDYFTCGNSTQVHSQRLPQHEQRRSSKKSCDLCRENKRRSLAAYIKGKSKRNSCDEIHEEEEDIDMINKEDNTNIDEQKLQKTSKNNETKEIKK